MRKVALRCVVVLLMLGLGSVRSDAQKKPGTYTPVPLIVTVHATDSLNRACGICGDGFETDTGDTIYRDGEFGVSAKIDKYGSLIIDFQTTSAKIRRLVYLYSGQTPVPPGDGPNHYVSTIGANLHTMGINESVSVGSCPLYDDPSGQPQYRHSFNRDCQGGIGIAEDPPGDPLQVTRIHPTTWVVETTGPARAFSITTTGRPKVQDFGQFDLPFKMTLMAKQQ